MKTQIQNFNKTHNKMRNTILTFTALFAFLFVSFGQSQAAGPEKKVQSFQNAKVLPFSVEQVWQVVALDYGAIAKSHPKIIKSEYTDGALAGGEGVERICYFNESGSQFLKEKMVDFDPANFQFTNTVYQAGKFPVDPEYTRAIYKVRPIDANSCELVFDMEFRTKPAMMGGMMKSNFQKLIDDYFIAVEHHLATGESVNKDNFKQIKKQYASK